MKFVGMKTTTVKVVARLDGQELNEVANTLRQMGLPFNERRLIRLENDGLTIASVTVREIDPETSAEMLPRVKRA